MKQIKLHIVTLFLIAANYANCQTNAQVYGGDIVKLNLATTYKSIQWQESTDSINWTDISGATYSPFSYSTLYAPPKNKMYFRARTFDSAVQCSNACTPVKVVDVQDETLGYRLWLRYTKVTDSNALSQYQTKIQELVCESTTEIQNSARQELLLALGKMTDQPLLAAKTTVTQNGAIIIGTPATSSIIKGLNWDTELAALGDEGFKISNATVNGKNCIVIASTGDNGVLYGAFRFIRSLQKYDDISNLNITEKPKIKFRVLNHWDNWSGSIERGYTNTAGNDGSDATASIFRWEFINSDGTWQTSQAAKVARQRIVDYCRANASIGINGAVINNVNAQYDYVMTSNLAKVGAIGSIFKQYGMKLYLTVKYDTPTNVTNADGTKAASLVYSNSKPYWVKKVAEIVAKVPNFGGFLMKADSEGQPGPWNTLGISHSEGSKPMAEALGTYNCVLFWRSFVYSASSSTTLRIPKLDATGTTIGNNGLLPADCMEQCYAFFKVQDGFFPSNVILQSKYGPRDFQPREAINPLFGGIEKSESGVEFQITQEYLGQIHFASWVTLWKWWLEFDMLINGQYTPVKRIVDGTTYNKSNTLMAGVPNIGNRPNWTGNSFQQYNWYGFGRLCWDADLTEETIADEWTKQTLGNDQDVLLCVKTILKNSYNIYEKTAMVGAPWMMQDGNHLNPNFTQRNIDGRNVSTTWGAVGLGREANGIGMARAQSGGFTSQYSPALKAKLSNSETCPKELLLWFHHLPWTYQIDGVSLNTWLRNNQTEGKAMLLQNINSLESLGTKISPAYYQLPLSRMKDQYNTYIPKWEAEFDKNGFIPK